MRAAALVLGLLGVLAFVGLTAALPTDPEVFRTILPDRPPLDAMLGFTDDQWRRHALRVLLLGPAAALVAFALARRALPTLERPALVAGVVSVAGTALLAGAILRGRALVEDELTYRMQALLYAGGRLGDRTIPPWHEGAEPFTIITRAGFTGKYLPGEPLLQIPGALLGVPAFSHLPLAALTLWAFHRALADVSRPTRDLATVLLALSPLFVFTGATGLSHTASLACVTLAFLGLTLVREGRPVAGALVAGGALGFGLLVRVQSVVPFGGVLGLWVLGALVQRRQWAGVGALIGSASLGIAAILAYDAALTGDLLRLPWYLYRPVEHFGFGMVFAEGPVWEHTPWQAVRNLAVTLVRFNAWWLGWPVSLAPLVFVRRRDVLAGTTPLLAAGAGLLVFNLFYYSTGVSDTGPVYAFELLLPACLVGATVITRAASRWSWVGPAVAVHLVLGTGSFWLEHAARLAKLADAVHARAAVLDALPDHSMLFVWPLPREELPGWIGTFPVRDREPDAAVLTYPQMEDAWCRAVIAAHPDRACFYLGESALVPCATKWP